MAAPARGAAGSRLGLWLALGAGLAACAPHGSAVFFLLLYNTSLAALFLWDRGRLERARLQVRRSLPEAPFAQAEVLRCRAHEQLGYALDLTLDKSPSLRLWLEESAPLGFGITPPRARLELAPGARGRIALSLHAERHGIGQLTHVYTRRESALGLCAWIEAAPCASELRAYPDLPFQRTPLPGLALAQPGRADKPRHSAEQGGEVERLREYAPTDAMRSIDWKATAKRGRPITRAYQPERSQTLWLVLDASRGMLAPAAEDTPHTRFLRAIEAALSLAATALGQGDQVGLLVYGRSLRLCIEPRRGRAQLFALIEALLRVHPEPCELNASGLLSAFAEQAKKRALFVFFTDLDSSADLTQLATHAALLTRRHLALCVSLSGRDLAQRLRAPLEDESAVYRRVAAIYLEEERERLKQNLHNSGLFVIESELSELAQAAVREYQRQKRAGRL